MHEHPLRIHRQIAYHQFLRWRFWLPFGAGLPVALMTRLPATPDITWLLPCFALIGCVWRFVHGPRHWPTRCNQRPTPCGNCWTGCPRVRASPMTRSHAERKTLRQLLWPVGAGSADTEVRV
jgi:hypothetical protein